MYGVDIVGGFYQFEVVEIGYGVFLCDDIFGMFLVVVKVVIVGGNYFVDQLVVMYVV